MPESTHPGIYVGCSDWHDVLHEQLDFLTEYHTGRHCGPECQDCQREAAIVKLLMLPFYRCKEASSQ